MFRRDLLMAFAKRQVLCGLDETLGAVSELLDVHSFVLHPSRNAPKQQP